MMDTESRLGVIEGVVAGIAGLGGGSWLREYFGLSWWVGLLTCLGIGVIAIVVLTVIRVVVERLVGHHER